MSPTQRTLHHLEGAGLCREGCGAMEPIRLEVWSWSMRATRRPKALDSATTGTMTFSLLICLTHEAENCKGDRQQAGFQ